MIPPTDPEDMALLHFTSGTTGTPKGAVHVHGAVVAHHATGYVGARPARRRRVLVHRRPRLGDRHVVRDHRAADPRGHQHRRRSRVRCRALVPDPPGPAGDGLVHGADGAANADEGRRRRWLGATTCRTCASSPASASRSTRRRSCGAGTPGLPVHDNWWQTETGGIMIANLAGSDIRPGSMGRPLPGVEAAVLAPATTAVRPSATATSR